MHYVKKKEQLEEHDSNARKEGEEILSIGGCIDSLMRLYTGLNYHGAK